VSAAVPAAGRGLEADALTLEQLAARLLARFPSATTATAFGELTLQVAPEQVAEVVAYCRDDEELRCELLADLSAVHWPAGDQIIERQISTTGWPEYRVSRDEGVIELLYVMRSLSRNHWFRISTGVPDDAPRVPSVVALFPTAGFLEREVYDFFGVDFEGHPHLTRIIMPDDWIGHPQRKDYPLGGVTIDYENDKFIPPPNERSLREVID
jgi:NADH-quinone oxidoreductase subunit C